MICCLPIDELKTDSSTRRIEQIIALIFTFSFMPPLHTGEVSNVAAWFGLFAFHCGMFVYATGADFCRAEMAGHYTPLSGQEHVCI